MNRRIQHELVAFHEDAFYAYFKPYRHPQASWEIWENIGLETFGEDWKLVQSLDPRYVWTVVEGDHWDEPWICPGLRMVNRHVYLVTEIPHDWAPVNFRCPEKRPWLTELGLKRQLTQLKQVMDHYRDTQRRDAG
jgi:hypothetical protein